MGSSTFVTVNIRTRKNMERGKTFFCRNMKNRTDHEGSSLLEMSLGIFHNSTVALKLRRKNAISNEMAFSHVWQLVVVASVTFIISNHAMIAMLKIHDSDYPMTFLRRISPRHQQVRQLFSALFDIATIESL